MMLRHIFLLSLAMTVCSTFMPAKVSAATFTVTPSGEISKIPNDLIDFTFVLQPPPSTNIRMDTITFDYDFNELQKIGEALPRLGEFTNDSTLLTLVLKFRVLTPVKDGQSDAWATVNYTELGNPMTLDVNGADVVPPQTVPEPLTIFGTAMGLGGGILFKRKSFKKVIS